MNSIAERASLHPRLKSSINDLAPRPHFAILPKLNGHSFCGIGLWHGHVARASRP